MSTLDTITQKLDEEKIPYTIFEHAPVFTSEEAALICGHSKEEGMKRGAKAMILRSEGKFCQFVLPGNAKLDFKRIKEILYTESASFATPEEVEKAIGCKPGAVPPFGSLFGLPTFVDKSLLNNEEIDFNAGKHEITITMTVKDRLRTVKPKMEEFAR